MAVQTIELAINVETKTGGPHIDIFSVQPAAFVSVSQRLTLPFALLV